MTVVRRAGPADFAQARAIVDEYGDAIEVAIRDDDAALRAYLNGPDALWLAEREGRAVGCVALRALPAVDARACEVKRLYVRPAERGSGLAARLMDALEAHARAAGFAFAYLDTKDDLHAAIRFYRRRGYASTARYNDNPQATIFMRLDLRV